MQAKTVATLCKKWASGRPLTPVFTGSQARVIPPDILEYIVSKEGLFEQRFMSLKERCAHLWDRKRLWIGPHGLSNIYKRHGIGYRKARAQTKRMLGDEELQGPVRKAAARDLLHLMAQKMPVVYVDETTIQVSSS